MSRDYIYTLANNVFTVSPMEIAGKRKRDSESPVHDQERPQKNAKSDGDATDTQIVELLDLTSCTTFSDISTRFDEIADALFFDFRLSVTCGGTQTEFDILEIEFYLKKPDCHDDPFTHGSEVQAKSGLWFVIITACSLDAYFV
jgi:hypothetical protein